MTRAKELLDAATPLPWGDDPPQIAYGDFGWYVPGSPMGEVDDSEQGRANLTLAHYAVNRLPAYEAAVELLREVLARAESAAKEGSDEFSWPFLDETREALARQEQTR
jgi:hypothetical protein